MDPTEDQLYLLTLCLELQLDLLLVALRPAGPATHVDLTGDAPVVTASGVPVAPPQRLDWLAARYAAIADAVEEMLANPEIRSHPAVRARLVEARATCEARLSALPGAPGPVPSQSVPATPPWGLALSGGPDDGRRVEAGHFLG